MQNVVVKGEPNALLGQVVAAYVVTVDGTPPESVPAQIRRHCGERLARHKKPVKVYVRPEPLMGARQKVDRSLRPGAR